jgi:hypothetical protein
VIFAIDIPAYLKLYNKLEIIKFNLVGAFYDEHETVSRMLF